MGRQIYNVSVFSLTCPFCQESQPLPDYHRWVDTCELHFMTLQESSLLEAGAWDTIPGMFLPSKIVDLCFLTIPSDIGNLIALLAWVNPSEMKEYYSKCDKQMTNTVEVDKRRENWKENPLYRDNTKEDLQKLCHSLRIPTASSLQNCNLQN